MNEEVTLCKKYTHWRVFFKNRVSKLVTTRPMTPSECLKYFRTSYGVMWMENEKVCSLQKKTTL